MQICKTNADSTTVIKNAESVLTFLDNCIRIGNSKFIVLLREHSVNVFTFTPDYEYSWSNTENLLLPIRMQLFTKVKTFCLFFIAVLEYKLNFENFETKC